MKHIFFTCFLLIVSKVHSQNTNDDIQRILEHLVGRAPNAVNSPVTLHPDTGLNISQFLEKYNYPLEYHDVTTEDGFILTMHRIPYGKNEQIEQQMANKTKPVMFLVHCFSCSSMDYIWQGPNISLAFLLADLGYDVWLANGRGNVHSMRHQTLTPNDTAFWDYSFHEKGYYDLPASIDYIINYTKVDNITYIGHSQGTTEALVLTSTRPEYNKKINLLVLLSPIAYLENLESPLIKVVFKYLKAFELFFNAIDLHGIAYGPLIPFITKELCNENSSVQEICIDIIGVIVGFDTPQVDKDTLTVYLTNTPNGLSLKELYHFGQEIESGNGMNTLLALADFLENGYFRQYDYGNLGNILHYGSATPPSYDLQKITVPIAAYYSKNDFLAEVSDVERFFSELPNEPVEKHLIEYELFNHLDFVTAKDVKTLLYDKLIEVLQKYSPVL